MSKIWYSYELDQLVKDLEFVPYRLKKRAIYEAGKTYWCSYWQKWYKVLEAKEKTVKIVWQDGKIAEHATSLNTMRDYELRPFESLTDFGDNLESFRANYDPVNNEQSLTAAEIRALCCAGIIDETIAYELQEKYYYKAKHAPNDHTYYFVIHLDS